MPMWTIFWTTLKVARARERLSLSPTPRKLPRRLVRRRKRYPHFSQFEIICKSTLILFQLENAKAEELAAAKRLTEASAAPTQNRVPNGMVRITHNPLTNSAVITPLYGPLESSPSYLQQPLGFANPSQPASRLMNPAPSAPTPVIPPPVKLSQAPVQQPSSNAASSTPSSSSSQPQQMVTIRRVMQPNLSEPVVTVTVIFFEFLYFSIFKYNCFAFYFHSWKVIHLIMIVSCSLWLMVKCYPLMGKNRLLKPRCLPTNSKVLPRLLLHLLPHLYLERSWRNRRRESKSCFSGTLVLLLCVPHSLNQ